MGEMALWFLEDPLGAFRDSLLIVIPSSSSSQLSLILGRKWIRGDFDIEHSLKMFGWRTDNAGHLLKPQPRSRTTRSGVKSVHGV
ncbi:hypothetical protein VZT92_003898 [Zoarces viviparus]|uniref:Uncharacterized protein n=1 Tax=Zoarces viviparus TaxID=48416 RepID=A0AAW1FWR2_ZOAVI